MSSLSVDVCVTDWGLDSKLSSDCYQVKSGSVKGIKRMTDKVNSYAEEVPCLPFTAFSLRIAYAEPSTDVGYHAILLLCDVRY